MNIKTTTQTSIPHEQKKHKHIPLPEGASPPKLRTFSVSRNERRRVERKKSKKKKNETGKG
jgi:hypothetical protein